MRSEADRLFLANKLKDEVISGSLWGKTAKLSAW